MCPAPTPNPLGHMTRAAGTAACPRRPLYQRMESMAVNLTSLLLPSGKMLRYHLRPAATNFGDLIFNLLLLELKFLRWYCTQKLVQLPVQKT